MTFTLSLVFGAVAALILFTTGRFGKVALAADIICAAGLVATLFLGLE